MTEDARYEMLWDCKYCGQKKLLGLTHRFCASCGAPQDPGARYFPSDADKVAVADHPFVGADVGCAACGTFVSRAAKCCTNCGGPLSGGKDVQLRGEEVRADAAAFAQGQKGALAPNLYQGQAPPPPPAPPAKKSSLGLILGILGGVLVLALVALLVSAFWRKSGTFEVAGHTWLRTIDVETYGATRKEAWCDELPGGAKVVSRKREERSKEKVQDGEDCQVKRKDLGDGTFKQVRECQPRYKSKAVMDDRCTFEVMAWKRARTLKAEGKSLEPAPAWPRASLRTGTCEGCEREGARDEKYEVLFTSDGAEHACAMPEAKWRAFTKGQRVEGKVRVVTGGLDCASLR